MSKRLRARTLDAKMLVMILAAGLAALLVYFGAYKLSTLALNKIYMSPESVSTRQAEIYADFYQFVVTRHIAGSDAAAAAKWPGNNEYITILIYKDEQLNMRIGGGGAQSSSSMSLAEKLQYNSQYGKLYPMRFSDGMYYITISDNSQAREDNINRIVAVVLGAVAFVFVMLLFIRRLTRRIVRLSREAEIIGGGDLEAPITRSGEDELSTLANEMDQMRRSVIERMGNERRAWEANSELITAISHDIRTPMTALIGYLGLLNAEGFDDKEKAGQFASSAYAKAMELKDLTDELFRYFLVFGRSELELNLEELDARLLLDQLFAEAQFDLVDAGFTVDSKEFEGEGSIRVDPLYLKRVLDNLVSNAKKYADKAKPISVRAELSEGSLRIAMSNAVAKAMDRVESTKIGLRTCEKIMSSMQGSFSSELNGETFTAYLSLPVLYPDDKKAKR